VTLPLAYLRSVQNSFLPDVCTIQRVTETSTGDGVSSSWATHLAGVACRVSPLAASASEALGADSSLQAVAQWTVWLPALTDVTVKDRIVYGSRTFEIARVGARSYETVRECICREVV
jgi:head-tail adaptor